MNVQPAMLLDLGKVLIDFDHRIATRRIQSYTALDAEAIYQLFFDSPLTDRFERGLITPEDFFQEVKKLLSLNADYDTFVPIWNEIFTPKPAMLEMLHALQPRYPLYMVSNLNQLHFLYLRDTFPEYFKPFTRLFLSYELKKRKPDRDLYHAIIQDIDVSADRIVYIDDRLELVEAAQALGIDAFVFKAVEQFRRELSARHIEWHNSMNVS